MGREDYIRLIIAGAGAIAWWLNQRKQSRAAEKAPRKEAASEDPDLAERTRRIREEIQRKIEQRAKAYKESVPAGPSRETPPPLIREVAQRRTVEPPMIAKSGTTRAEVQRNAEILEEQAALADRLRQAMELKAAAARRVQFENQISNEEAPSKPVAATALTEDLRNPAALRRAFVLREIVGPPVALR